jgi:hypothetical protein
MYGPLDFCISLQIELVYVWFMLRDLLLFLVIKDEIANSEMLNWKSTDAYYRSIQATFSFLSFFFFPCGIKCIFKGSWSLSSSI